MAFSPPASRSIPLLLVAVGLLALGACGDDSSTAATTVPSTSSTTSPPTSEAPGTPLPSPTTVAPATVAPTTGAPTTVTPTTVAPTTVAPTTVTPTTDPGSNDADCLIGEWIVTDEVLDAYFDVVAERASFDSIDNDGVMRFAFSGTEYVRALDSTVTMLVGGSEYVAVHETTARQPYTVVDRRFQQAGPLSVEGSTTFTKDGESFVDDPGDLFVGIIPLADVDALGFTCDGPTLTIGAGPDLDATYELPLAAAE